MYAAGVATEVVKVAVVGRRELEPEVLERVALRQIRELVGAEQAGLLSMSAVHPSEQRRSRAARLVASDDAFQEATMNVEAERFLDGV